MKYALKILCNTPKGKAEECSKSWSLKYFELIKKPVNTRIMSDSQFFIVYEYDDIKHAERIINKKIPNAENNIRKFYSILIHIVERGNNLGKKGAWTIEKTRRWILKRLKQKGMQDKDLADFTDAIQLTDKESMLQFLYKPLFFYTLYDDKMDVIKSNAPDVEVVKDEQNETYPL